MYDPVIGRWTTVDPERQYASPYVSMGNNPINMVDPDGAFSEGPGDGNGASPEFIAQAALMFGSYMNAQRTAARFEKSGYETVGGWITELFTGEALDSYVDGVSDFASDVTTLKFWGNLVASPITNGIESAQRGFDHPMDMMISDAGDYISNMPNMSLSQISYDAGYASGPILGGLALRGVSSGLRGYGLSFTRYPNAGGGGLSLTYNRGRVLSIDYHRFRIGGRKTGYTVKKLHLDIPSKGVKHWPWHQIDKWKRGVN